jgi:hypothetical protein
MSPRKRLLGQALEALQVLGSLAAGDALVERASAKAAAPPELVSRAVGRGGA